MFNISVVHRSLRHSRVKEFFLSPFPQEPVNGQDKEIAYLIHDIYGGKILKTPQNKGWHFYNQINGDRLDFSNPMIVTLTSDSNFKDIPSNQKELSKYIDPNDYYTFYNMFIMAFEEILGLKNNASNGSRIASASAYFKNYRYEITYKVLKPPKVHPINALSIAFRQK